MSGESRRSPTQETIYSEDTVFVDLDVARDSVTQWTLGTG